MILIEFSSIAECNYIEDTQNSAQNSMYSASRKFVTCVKASINVSETFAKD